MVDAVLQGDGDTLSDLLVPHFDSLTLNRVIKVCTSTRQWAANHHRIAQLRCGANPKDQFPNVPHPNKKSDANGGALICTERVLKIRPGAVVTWVDANGDNNYEEMPFGSNVDAANSKVDIDVVRDGTDEVVETLKGLDSLDGLEDLPQLKFKITRLSSHFTPPAKFCVRITVTLAFFTNTDVTAQYVLRTAPFEALSAIPSARTARVRHERRADAKAAKQAAARAAAAAAAEAATRAAMRARDDEDFVLNVLDDAALLLEGL